MGLCLSMIASSNIYISNPEISSNGKAKLYSFLGLCETDVSRMYAVFERIEIESNRHASSAAETYQQRRRKGYVRAGDVMTYLLDEERTMFADTIITLFAKSNRRVPKTIQRSTTGTGTLIDFHCFVLSFWNFLTVSTTTLPMFIFDLYDVDDSDFLDKDELHAMLVDFYGPTYLFQGNKAVERLERIICNDRTIAQSDCSLSRTEFQKFVTLHQTFLQPVYKLQMLMRSKLLSQHAWDSKTSYRAKMSCLSGFVPTRVLLRTADVAICHTANIATVSSTTAPTAPPPPSASNQTQSNESHHSSTHTPSCKSHTPSTSIPTATTYIVAVNDRHSAAAKTSGAYWHPSRAGKMQRSRSAGGMAGSCGTARG